MKTRRTLVSPSSNWRMDADTAASIGVARTLRHLLDEQPPFHLVNSLLAERVEVDHLAVGVTGVFAIETCSEEGEVALDRAGNCHEAFQRARRGAAAVRERLRRRGIEVRVQGILCVPFSNMTRPQYVDGMIVARPEHLEYLIRHWPGQTLTPAQSTRIFTVLQPRVHRAAA